MSFPLSRAMSAATAGYGVFALAKPSHLGAAMDASRSEASAYALLATTYGARDIPISLAGLLGRSDGTVRTAMRLRIALDLADAAILASRAGSSQVRSKVLAATLGWATLNTLALMIDTRRSA